MTLTWVGKILSIIHLRSHFSMMDSPDFALTHWEFLHRNWTVSAPLGVKYPGLHVIRQPLITVKKVIQRYVLVCLCLYNDFLWLCLLQMQLTRGCIRTRNSSMLPTVHMDFLSHEYKQGWVNVYVQSRILAIECGFVCSFIFSYFANLGNIRFGDV